MLYAYEAILHAIPLEDGRLAPWAFEAWTESDGLPYRTILETSSDQGQHWRAVCEFKQKQPGTLYEMVRIGDGQLAAHVRVVMLPMASKQTSEANVAHPSATVAGRWKIMSTFRFKAVGGSL